MRTINVSVNGKQYSHDVEPRMLLVHYLREVIGLTGTHVGCETSLCGACTIEFNGKAVPKSHDFPTVIADIAPGQKITLKIVRDKKEQTVGVKIGELPDEGDTSQAEARDAELGLRVQRITPEAARRLGLSSAKGVLVVEVQPGSPADQVGVEPADVIREINQRPVSNVKEFERATRQGRRGDRILLLVQRGDNAVFFAVKRKN